MTLNLQKVPLGYQVQADDIAAISGQNRQKGIHPIPDPSHPSVVILCTIEGGDYPDRWLDDRHTRLRYCLEGRKTPGTAVKVYKPEYQSNRAVSDSRAQGYPVHVFWRQEKRTPFRYAGAFVFERFDQEAATLAFILTKLDYAETLRQGAEQEAAQADRQGDFEPGSIQDARERAVASIVRRRGQPAFRQRLLEAYGGTCAVTGCDLPDALEAAHITPYRGPETNHPTNGLLLRSDIHTLFDLGLIAVEATTMTLVLHAKLAGTVYANLAGESLHVPVNPNLRPNHEALNQHRAWAGL